MPGPFERDLSMEAEILEKSDQYRRSRVEPEDPKEVHRRLQEAAGYANESIDAEVIPMPKTPEPSRRKDKAAHILENLEDGEPFFIFRAKDFFSVMVLANYASIIEQYGPDDADFHHSVIDQLGAFKQWQKENVHKVRYPD